jgi:hypothetical protein
LASSAILLTAAFGFASAARAQPGKPAPAASAPASGKQSVSKPLWRELTPRQQHALEPLASLWDGLTESHKRKWLAISLDYAKLSPAEQEILQKRMTEWAGLSNQERAQARFNFADVKQVPATERKAKWEAYQALSDEEKNKLAARAKTAPNPGAASTIRPVPAQKLVPVPASALEGRMPRIQLAPPASTPVATTKPPAAAPAISSAPVSPEAQVPAPSPPNAPVDPAPVAPPAMPPRTTDQPSSAP